MKHSTSSYKLKNGLTVILIDYPGINTLYAQLAVRVGSYYETAATNGISHLVEHLIARRIEHSARKNWAQPVIGAEIDALTFRSATLYKLAGSPDQLKQMVACLSGILDQKFDTTHIDAEKQNITQEILDDVSDANESINQPLRTNYYQNTSIGLLPRSNESTIHKLTKKQALDHFAMYYAPNNSILVLAGPLPGQVKEIIEHSFGPLITKPKIPSYPAFTPPSDQLVFTSVRGAEAHVYLISPFTVTGPSELNQWYFFTNILRRYLRYRVRDKGYSHTLGINLISRSNMAEIEIKSFVDSKKLAAFYHAFTQAVHDFKTEFGQEQFESLRERELWLVKDRQDDIEYEIEQAIWDTIHFHEIATSEQQLRALQSMSLTTIYEYFDRVIPKSKGHVFISGQTNQRVRKEITKIWAENPAK